MPVEAVLLPLLLDDPEVPQQELLTLYPHLSAPLKSTGALGIWGRYTLTTYIAAHEGGGGALPRKGPPREVSAITR